MNKNILIIVTAIMLFLNPLHILAQNEQPITISGKVTHEYRSNFIRLPDSLKLSDYRTNLFFNADHQQTVWQNGRLLLEYELRYHRYNEFQRYNRHDHLTTIKFQKPIIGGIKLHLSNEIRTRFSSTQRYSYYRNIFDIYVNLPITVKDRAYIGFQNWAKNYPKTSEYKKYRSSRIYSKFNIQLTRTTTLGLKFEFHRHEGNLYPGSTVPTLKLDLDGNRYVFQAMVDRILNRKVFASFSYRFENDMLEDIDDEQAGERYGDENEAELLAEDSDLGYLKNQGSLSALIKLNSRISIMTFYLVYKKNFKYWYIEPDGPKRRDRLIFLSHILKIKLYENLSLEIQHNYEDNHTNLEFYVYRMNSYAAGISIQY